MARIDGKPSRRRPGYTRQDVEAARFKQTYTPPSKRTAPLADAREVNHQLLGITDEILRDPDIDAPRDR